MVHGLAAEVETSNRTNKKAAQCAAFKMVGPVGLEPTTKGL